MKTAIWELMRAETCEQRRAISSLANIPQCVTPWIPSSKNRPDHCPKDNTIRDSIIRIQIGIRQGLRLVRRGPDVRRCRRRTLHPAERNPSRAAKRTGNPRNIHPSRSHQLTWSFFSEARSIIASHPPPARRHRPTVAATLPNGTSNFIYDPLGSVLVINDGMIAASVRNGDVTATDAMQRVYKLAVMLCIRLERLQPVWIHWFLYYFCI